MSLHIRALTPLAFPDNVASAARWQALGAYYASRGDAAAFAAGIDAGAARWQALGSYYASMSAAGIDASAARWQALGDYYTSMGDAAIFAAPVTSGE